MVVSAFALPAALPLSRPAPHLTPRAAAFKIRFVSRDSPSFRVRALAPTPTPPPAAKVPTRASAEQVQEYRLTAGVRAKTLVHICTSGTLCTSSVRHDGVPFGSHVDYVLDSEGRPVFMLAKNATHTKNLTEKDQCSLFCQPATNYGQDGCRATLVGRIAPLEGEDASELKELYIETHTHAADALQFPDLFSFHRMSLNDVFFVGGYGVVSQWVDVADFREAEPDPLAHDAPGIVADLNSQKTDDIKRLCKAFLAISDPHSCKMTALDRLGFDLRVWDSKGEIREYRVAFREVVSNRFDVQSALVKAFQEAWERENGYDETWEGEDVRPTILYYAPL